MQLEDTGPVRSLEASRDIERPSKIYSIRSSQRSKIEYLYRGVSDRCPEAIDFIHGVVGFRIRRLNVHLTSWHFDVACGWEQSICAVVTNTGLSTVYLIGRGRIYDRTHIASLHTSITVRCLNNACSMLLSANMSTRYTCSRTPISLAREVE
jgi:hypothetical protein